MLLDTAEELIGVKFLFAGSCAAQDADVKDNDVTAAGFNAIENVCEMVEIKLIADGDEDIAGLGADGFRSEFAFDFEIELIHLDVRGAGRTRAAFGDGEDDEEKNGESAASHGGDGLCEEVDDGDGEQGQRNEGETERKLNAVDREVQRNLKIAVAGLGVTEDENGEAIHGEGPDDAESVEVREKGDVAAADNNGEDLQKDDDVDNAIAGAEFRVGLAEPFAENTVFGDAV